jgi:hypothetical protein
MHAISPVQPYFIRPTLTKLAQRPAASYPTGTEDACSEGREVGRQAEAKNAYRCTSTPPHACMVWCLIKYRDNLTFNFQNLQNMK